MGDFNAYLCTDEKWGGGLPNYTAMKQFKYCLNECNLIDLGFKGPKYTWKRGRVKERIDRCVCNPEWMSKYKQAVSMHLPLIKSDHRPVLLKLTSNSGRRRRGPFRFLAAWLTNKNFPSVINKCWETGKGWMEASLEFRSQATDWSKKKFQKLSRKKERLMNRLEGINKILERGPNKFLEKLQK